MKESTKRTIKFRLKQITLFTLEHIYRAVIIVAIWEFYKILMITI